MNTDEKILNAALNLFSEKGYSATTTKMIANDAGVNEVTVFRHFENKRGIFNAIITKLIDTDELNEFYDNGITHDLNIDLTTLADKLASTYITNAPIIKMIFMDDELGHKEKKCVMKDVLPFKDSLRHYFNHMHNIGKISDNTEKCMKFFFFNIIGYLMNVFVMSAHPHDEEYYNWMVEKTISAISPEKG